MQRIQINILQKKLRVKLVTYRNYTKMHGQKNIKFSGYSVTSVENNNDNKCAMKRNSARIEFRNQSREGVGKQSNRLSDPRRIQPLPSRRMQHVSSNRRYTSTKLYGAKFKKTCYVHSQRPESLKTDGNTTLFVSVLYPRTQRGEKFVTGKFRNINESFQENACILSIHHLTL